MSVRSILGIASFGLFIIAGLSAQDEVDIVLPTGGSGAFDGNVGVIRSDDVTIRNDYVSEFFPLVAEPLEVQPYFENLVEPEGGDVAAFIYKDREAGTQDWYIQVVYPPYQRDAVHAIYEAVNQPGATSSSGGVRRHYRVRNRLASDLAEILDSTTISGVGFVEADDATNTLVVRDSGSDGRRSLAVAAYHDVPPRMVEMNIQIIEVDLNDNAQLGLDWDAWKNDLGGFLQTTSSSRSGLGGEFFSFDHMLNINASAVADFLNYLIGVGRATVVTNTNLTAINGEMARLESSRRVSDLRYFRGSGPGIRVNKDDPSEHDYDYLVNVPSIEVLTDVGRNSEGFFLSVRPEIGTETTRAEVLCRISTVVGLNALDEPQLSTSEVDTMLTLIDGETSLIGAFDTTRTLDVQRGLPLLRHIPFLGPYLFSVTTEQTTNTRLVVLATPRIDELTTYTDMDVDNGKPVDSLEYDPYYSIPDQSPPADALATAAEANREVSRAMAELEEELDSLE